MLRDPFFFRHANDDPGPAGRMLVAWRALDRSTALGLLGKAPLPDELRSALGLRFEEEVHSEARELESGYWKNKTRDVNFKCFNRSAADRSFAVTMPQPPPSHAPVRSS